MCSTNRWPSRCSISWQKARAVRPSPSTSNRTAVAVLGPDPDHVGPGDDAPLAGHAEAALQTGLLPAGGAMISGFTSSIYSSEPSSSTTHTRRSTPTWGAARPAPLASASVSIRSSISCMQPGIELRHRAADLGQTLVTLLPQFSAKPYVRNLPQSAGRARPRSRTAPLRILFHTVAVCKQVHAPIGPVCGKIPQQRPDVGSGGGVVPADQQAAVAVAVVQLHHRCRGGSQGLRLRRRHIRQRRTGRPGPAAPGRRPAVPPPPPSRRR